MKCTQMWEALTRKRYHNDDEKLKDAQAYIWIAILVLIVNLLIFIAQMPCWI